MTDPGGAVWASFGDMHSGSPFGVFPAFGEPWKLATGGNPLYANPLQELIWAHWCESWAKVGQLRRGKRLIMCMGGEPVEGDHHNTVDLLTKDIPTQERIAVACLREAMRLAKFNKRTDKFLAVKGSEAHSGPNGRCDENVMRQIYNLPADAPLDDRIIRDRMYVSVNGVIFDVAHKHGYRKGTREWTSTTSARAYLLDRYLKALKARKPMARYIIGHHYHNFLYADLTDDTGAIMSEAYVAPAFKLKDSYVYDVAAATLCNIGMLPFEIETDGATRKHHLLMEIDQDCEKDIEHL